MNIPDRVRSFFEKEPQSRDLSPSVVDHDRVDDHYLEDFKDRATKFQAVYDKAPQVPLGEPPPKCPSCGTDEPNWRREGDELLCANCEVPVAMPEGPYSLWDDMVNDAFRAHYTHKDPGVKPQEEIKESHELHRRIYSRMMSQDEFLDTKMGTQGDDISSAWATMSITERVRGEIEDGVLTEHAQRAQEMDQEQQKVEEAERSLEEMRERFQQNKMSQNDMQQASDLTDQHDAANAKLQALANDQQAAGIGVDVQEVIDAAIEEAREEVTVLSSMPGMEPGSQSRVDPDLMFELAEKWRNNVVTRSVAEMIGRMFREMRYKRANRVVGGFEEIVDLELGDEIARLIPSELAMLVGGPRLKKLFHKNWAEKSLLQFEIRGNEPEGKGPAVLCVDGSYSMSGDKNVWARAAVLSLLKLAHAEKRDVFVIEFASQGELKMWNFPGRKPLQVEDVLDAASHFFGGGTEITQAIKAAAKVISEAPNFKKADVVVLTDGEDRYQDDDEQIKQALAMAGVRIHGVAIGEGYGYLSQLCPDEDDVTHITDMALDGSNEATDKLAVNLA